MEKRKMNFLTLSKKIETSEDMFLSIFRFLVIPFYLILSLQNCEKIVDVAFSDNDDLQMGANLDKEIRSKPKEYLILENLELQNYVQSIVKQILKSPHIKKKKVYSYKVTILKDDKMVNAFCTPGGYIYVYTGLFKFLENEASLAAVLAHEIAHAEKRHVRQRMVSAMGLQIILSALLGNDASVWKEMGLQIAGSLALLSNSRSDELEADELGFLYLKVSPYYQGAMSYFFEKIAKEEKNSKMAKKMESLLSTHPIPEERLIVNDKRVKIEKVQPPIPSNLFKARYQNMIKKHLPEEEEVEDKG